MAIEIQNAHQSRWSRARGCCLHILWSNHRVSAGCFPPLDPSHITHQYRQLVYVLHWRVAEEFVFFLFFQPYTHTHTHKRFTYSTHWAKGFKLHQYATGVKAVGWWRGGEEQTECLCIGDDKNMFCHFWSATPPTPRTLHPTTTTSLLVPNTIKTTFVLWASRSEGTVSFFFFFCSLKFIFWQNKLNVSKLDFQQLCYVN